MKPNMISSVAHRKTAGDFCLNSYTAITAMKVYEEEQPEEDEMDEYADSDGGIRPKIVLVSYNEEYPPRYISPNTRFEIVGKVIG